MWVAVNTNLRIAPKFIILLALMFIPSLHLLYVSTNRTRLWETFQGVTKRFEDVNYCHGLLLPIALCSSI